MCRRPALRVATLAFAVFITTAPAFAAPHDDSPIGVVGRAIQLVLKQVRRVLHPGGLADIAAIPK